MDTRIDVVIVGAGLAGTYTALSLPSNLNIVILSAYEANSMLAQGGIAACIKDDDSFASHIEDTLVAGHFVNDYQSVKRLVEEGPDHIKHIKSLGIHFDQNPNGEDSATLEGGHSHKRVLHINGDQTGKAMMEGLYLELHRRTNITIIYDAHLIELLTDKSSPSVAGVVYKRNHQIHTLPCQQVVMATGGMGNLYQHTTNQHGSYGTGISIAMEAGARTSDLQYMQFHPTAYYSHTNNRFFS